MVMQGLTASSLKKNPALIPLFICLGVGMAGAVFYTIRLAARCPDVSWNKKKNPEPWEYWADKQYKFYRPSGKDLPPSPAPKF
ncbi:cytochrome c oxidase subunit NDUFA4 [Copidosoma floridanum]|uniref:cytochrome c oxidase subunit NDUFA4 n=1 Tax=Copidosoma floridanum TaxID=29053 RepID=UPI0006C9A37B|nr:cytochrome c oxidase subunit NDUFA4 [Copidosoma floridanum]